MGLTLKMADKMENGGAQTVGLSQLPLPQLEHLKSQVEEELRMLSDSLNQLKMAQQKFSDSLGNLENLEKRTEGKQMLVPMTGCMYVPGILKNTKKVKVDIGTGYYAEKSVAEAKDYFKRKVEFVGKQMEKIQPGLLEKQRIRQAILETMNAKIQQQFSSQGANKSPALKT